jgi:cell division septation protein DedD
MRTGLLRNLDQIQETDGPRGSRVGTLLLASLGVACVVFAVVAQSRRKAPPATHAPDPLGELVAQAKGPLPALSAELAGKDVTFPGLLSDESRTTTALAALHSAPTGASSAAAPLPATPLLAPPPAGDRLPVVPLPAKNIVVSSPVISRPRDVLTQMAKEASSVTTAPVDEGHAGGYQLQASSFRSEAEATAFATALRQRGHRAYTEPAQVLGRGTWYRVRIGPFKTQREAASYRADFEKREHLAPFIVEPPKDKPPSTR